MNATFIASVTGFLSALLMSAVSHFLLLKREESIRLQALRSRLNEEQLTAYKNLWACLAPTSHYYSDATIFKKTKEGRFFDTAAADDFIDSIRALFFSQSGLFLSKAVRKELFSLLNHLEKIRAAASDQSERLIKIAKKEKKEIRWKIQILIETIRTDVGLADVAFPDHSDA